jgi:hypothetical protein
VIWLVRASTNSRTRFSRIASISPWLSPMLSRYRSGPTSHRIPEPISYLEVATIP